MRLAASTLITAATVLTAFSAPAFAVSDFQLRTAGDRTSPFCGHYNGRDGSDIRSGSSLHVYRCFPTKRTCDRWFSQVQTAYPVALTRRPCARRN